MQAYFRLAQAVEAKQGRPQKQWRYLHCVEPDEAVRVEFKTATLRGQRRAGALRLHRRHAAGREKPTDSLRIHLVEHRLLRRQARPPYRRENPIAPGGWKEPTPLFVPKRKKSLVRRSYQCVQEQGENDAYWSASRTSQADFCLSVGPPVVPLLRATRPKAVLRTAEPKTHGADGE